MNDITQRIDAVSKISDIRISMGGIQPPPKSVKIELTARCNLRCKFCAVQTRNKQPKDDMDFEFFKKIAQDMRISGVEEIGLFYLGEPFMNVDLLVNAIKFCKNTGFPYTFITSNGAAATPYNIGRAMAAGIDSIKWSINSGTAKQFNDITGKGERFFDVIQDHIKDAWQIREHRDFKTILSASSILYEGNQKEIMQEFLDNEIIPFVDKHYWLPLYQMSMYKEKLQEELGYTPTAGNMGRIDENTMQPNRRPLPCWSAFTEGHVRVDGGLSACCFGADANFDMGHLDGSNFMGQWNSKKFQELREAQLKTLTIGQEALEGTVCKVCVVHKE